jgi:hypothetical protein
MQKIFFVLALLFTQLLSAAELSWNDLVYMDQGEKLSLQEKIIFPNLLIPPYTVATLESFEYLFYGVYMAIFNLTDCTYDKVTTELELFTSRLYNYEYGATLAEDCRLRIYITKDELVRPSLFNEIISFP